VAGGLLFHTGGTNRVEPPLSMVRGGYGSRVRWDLGAVRSMATTDGDQGTSQASAADEGTPCFKIRKCMFSLQLIKQIAT
jgi:hypothetical protein